MKERLPYSSPEFTPTPRIIDILCGTVSEPLQTISQKPINKGEIVTVRIATEGPCLFGLTDWEDLKEWSGIMNHVFLSARSAVYFAQEMQKKGHIVDAQLVLEAMLVSHAGRRQWDEAQWYPNIAPDAQEKRDITNEELGLQLIHHKAPKPIFELVAALGHGVERFTIATAVYSSLEYKLAVYADHRTSQKYEPLNTRMGDFLLGNFYDKNQITPELKTQVYAAMHNIIRQEKIHYADSTNTLAVSLAEADQSLQNLGARTTSLRLNREQLVGLILQDAQTEAVLEQAGIHSDNLSKITIPMPKWENEIRRKYVQSAQIDILKKCSTDQSIFPQDKWVNGYAVKLINLTTKD